MNVINPHQSLSRERTENRQRNQSTPELDNDGAATAGGRDSQDDTAARDDDRANAGADRRHAGADPGGDGGKGGQPTQDGGLDDDLEDHRETQGHDGQEQVQGQVQRLLAAAEAQKAEETEVSEDQQEADLAALQENVRELWHAEDDGQAEETQEQEGDDGHGEGQDH